MDARFDLDVTYFWFGVELFALYKVVGATSSESFLVHWAFLQSTRKSQLVVLI